MVRFSKFEKKVNIQTILFRMSYRPLPDSDSKDNFGPGQELSFFGPFLAFDQPVLGGDAADPDEHVKLFVA